MAKKIFVAATGKNAGKTTLSLSLLHMAQKKYGRVGFIKPLGPKPIICNGMTVDKDAALMAGVFHLEKDLAYMTPVVLPPGGTRKVLDGELSSEALLAQAKDACAELEKHCEFIVIEGSGHSGVGTVVGMSNARIAKELNAPVLIVSAGGIGNTVDSVSLNLSLFRQEGVSVRLALVNKLIPEKRESCLKYLKKAFDAQNLTVLGGFNYSPVLANPTLSRIAQILERPLKGDASSGSHIAHHIQLGAASAQRVADLLEPSSLLLVNSSRDDLLVMAASLYQLPEYRQKIVGLVIPGLNPVAPIPQQIIDGSGVPYVRTEITNAEAFSIIRDDVSKITPDDHEKIDLVRALAEKELDFSAIDRLIT